MIRLLAKRSEIDQDMIEVYSETEPRVLWFIVHSDLFTEMHYMDEALDDFKVVRLDIDWFMREGDG